MTSSWVRSLAESATKVFQDRVSVSLTRKNDGPETERREGRPVAILIGLTGQPHGVVVFGIDQRFADAVSLRLALPFGQAVASLAEAVVAEAIEGAGGGAVLVRATPAVVLVAERLTFDFLSIPSVGLTLQSRLGMLEIDVAFSFSDEAPLGPLS